MRTGSYAPVRVSESESIRVRIRVRPCYRRIINELLGTRSRQQYVLDESSSGRYLLRTIATFTVFVLILVCP